MVEGIIPLTWSFEVAPLRINNGRRNYTPNLRFWSCAIANQLWHRELYPQPEVLRLRHCESTNRISNLGNSKSQWSYASDKSQLNETLEKILDDWLWNFSSNYWIYFLISDGASYFITRKKSWMYTCGMMWINKIRG